MLRDIEKKNARSALTRGVVASFLEWSRSLEGGGLLCFGELLLGIGGRSHNGSIFNNFSEHADGERRGPAPI